MTAPTPITPLKLVPPFTTLPAGAAADNTNGNSFPNDGATSVSLNNSAGSSATVVFHATETVGAQALTVSDWTVTVPANTRVVVPALDKSIFGNSVKLTASASTVLVLAFSIRP